MKKGIAMSAAALMLSAVFAVPTFADNYDFSSGTEQAGIFGRSTSSDNLVTAEMLSDNTRRNKDTAALPAPYGYFSGDIPTDPASLYHDKTAGGIGGGYASADNYGAYSSGTGGSYGGAAIGTGGTTNTTASNITANLPPIAGLEASTSTLGVNVAPKYYADGSIGTLYVERTGKTIKVYEGEELANLKKGAGHFASTSAWEGNVAMCGHNRGSWAYFSFVKDLQNGDRVTYTTLYGARVYEVFSKETISETDYSKLGWTADNALTLITCVEGVSELRWAAVLREVRQCANLFFIHFTLYPNGAIINL